eukprot:5647362-Pleurochrysis_carterae.AAC.7
MLLHLRRMKECPLSCGVCEGVKCADSNSTQCSIWAEHGECLNNPLAVMKSCPDACGVRGRAPPSAPRRSGCSRSPSSRSRLDQAWMSAFQRPRPRCRSCWVRRVRPVAQVCSTVCQDHDESCLGWAAQEECETNKAFMFRVCPAACGICQLLETPEKEEL